MGVTFEVGLLVDQEREALTDDGVVVDDHDPLLHAIHPPSLCGHASFVTDKGGIHSLLAGTPSDIAGAPPLNNWPRWVEERGPTPFGAKGFPYGGVSAGVGCLAGASG